jgi:hypothetical protein
VEEVRGISRCPGLKTLGRATCFCRFDNEGKAVSDHSLGWVAIISKASCPTWGGNPYIHWNIGWKGTGRPWRGKTGHFLERILGGVTCGTPKKGNNFPVIIRWALQGLPGGGRKRDFPQYCFENPEQGNLLMPL